MSRIDDPKYSRPIDVHRWSDHPEVKALVKGVWEGGYLPEGITGVPGVVMGRTGPKPKMAFHKQLRVLILDLYVAWLDDPELSIGVSMSVNNWNTNSRYNALYISKKIVPIINALVETDLLDLSKGSYAGPGARTNRTTRIRASEKLQAMFRDAKFVREDVTRFEGEEIIVLRDEKEAGKRGKEVEYQDNDNTVAMRTDLLAYNDLLASSFIDIATLQAPVVEAKEGVEASRVTIHRDNSRLRRVFSRSDWEMNGRFYGGWWQQVGGDWRSKIFIDDQPTIEVDFKGLHVAMLYAEAGQDMLIDPYHIPGVEVPPDETGKTQTVFLGLPTELVRKLAKRLVLTAINAMGKSAAYSAFRDGFSSGHPGKTMTNKDLEEILGVVLARNPILGDVLFSDQGIRLMYLDSQITALVHRHFTEQGIPVLSVHDSYIIDHMKVAELTDVMAEASRAVMGRALPTAIKLPDMPEYEKVTDKQLQEHIENRKGIRCAGYMDRVFGYQELTGRNISPVGRGDAREFRALD